MEPESDKKLSELKERLDSGEYAVDPRAVADAILRRSRDAALVRAELSQANALELTALPCLVRPAPLDRDQTACSKPANRLVASEKLTPGSPWMTRPIQVIRRAGSACVTAASTTLRALSGAQVHSS